MGNKLACGCGPDVPKGYGDTPYSKQMSKNLVRFWAEVFLLAQDGARESETKWQLVLPKLVPVNVARVQDSPATVSHITAYNTKIDKVLDLIVYYPGMQVFRGSDCFLYWLDPAKGLTWGLNFITPDDANFFLDLLYGKSSGILSRRANSSGSLDTKFRQGQRSTSTPGSPDSSRRKRGPSVKFAEPPVSRSAGQSRQSTPQLSRSQQSTPVRSNTPQPPDPFQMYVTGKRLSHWKTMLPSPHATDSIPAPHPITELKPSISTGEYDNVENYDGIPYGHNSNCSLWQHSSVMSSNPKLTVDSGALEKMLSPLGSTTPPSTSRSLIGDDELRQAKLTIPPPICSQRRHWSQAHTPPEYTKVHVHRRPKPAAHPPSSSSSLSSIEPALGGEGAESSTRSTWSRTKRASIHLIAGENGKFRCVPENHPLLSHHASSSAKHDHIQEESVAMSLSLNDSGSLSSSLDGSCAGVMNEASGYNQSQCRKSGLILLKKWLQPQDHCVQALATETWHQRWALLKGFNIHLYSIGTQPRDDASSTSSNSPSNQPSISQSGDMPIVIDLLNCLVQAIPEYPRREHVFCLSTGVGQAYLLQVSCETELEGWLQGIHTAASFALARTSNRDVVAKTLKKEIIKMDQKIETVSKMIKLSQLPSVGTVSLHQQGDWEEEFELLHVQLFMARCYWAAIKCADLPSCKKVLTSASSATKLFLTQHIGAFTVSSMHSLVFAKSTARHRGAIPPPPPPTRLDNVHVIDLNDEASSSCASTSRPKSLIHVSLPTGQVTVVGLCETDTCGDMLKKACEKVGLNPPQHFILLRRSTLLDQTCIPSDGELMFHKMTGNCVELREKLVYHVHLTREQDKSLGLTVRAQKHNNNLSALVTALDEKGQACSKGLMLADELIAINEQKVSCMSSQQVEELLHDSGVLCLILRTKRLALPVWLESIGPLNSNESLFMPCTRRVSDTTGEETWLSDSCNLLRQKVKYRNTVGHRSVMTRGKQRYSLPIIPPPIMYTPMIREAPTSTQSSPHRDKRRSLMLGSNLVKRMSTSEPGTITPSNPSKTSAKMGSNERLEKIIFELAETEKAYIEDMERLQKLYLDPLIGAGLISEDEVINLSNTAQAICRFQRGFYEELQEATGQSFANDSHLKNSILRIGGVFLNASSKFKVYSAFCAAHFRVQKLLKQGGPNDELIAFLQRCNVEKQHATTIESYLIKPVQRVLRYPLFLQQLKSLTCEKSAENSQISEALSKMEKVAEYINEMQRIYEEYGVLFSTVQTQRSKDRSLKKVSLELNELLMYGELDWLNAHKDQNSKKRSIPLQCLCFVFKTAILLAPQVDRVKTKKSKNCTSHEYDPRVIPITDLEVNGSDLGSTQGHFLWILIQIDRSSAQETVYHFANRQQDIKVQFLRAIRKAGLTVSHSTSSVASYPPRSRTCERTDVSSPDSGFPQTISLAAKSNAACNGIRPKSLHSNQSDGGYDSNGELRNKLHNL